ncbi:MAG: PAS domain-containing protein [Bacteroidales bacterium]|nr:PAS domain-containing protein [Bacteroidales bacterium]
MRSFGPEWARDNFHPDDLHILQERIGFFKQNKGETYAGVYRVKHKNGHWVWVYSNATVLKRDEYGIPEQVIGICIDFTSDFYTDKTLDELQRESHRQRYRDLIAGLTHREKDVLRLIAAGKNYREIAEALYISPHTANTHRKNLLFKLGLHTAAELGRFAAECGLG